MQHEETVCQRETFIGKAFPKIDPAHLFRISEENLHRAVRSDAPQWTVSQRTLSVRRITDIIAAFAGLIITLPILLLAIAAVRISSRGPVFYSQTRIGYHGKPFMIYKLRSMYKDSEPCGPCLTQPNDKRITPVGRLLRSTHIDELPQLWNVLRGDMTLVSYRPERPYFIYLIIKRYPDYIHLLHERPGLISRGIIECGYASDEDSLVKRAEIDVNYMGHRTTLSDSKTFLSIFPQILHRRGR